MELCWAEKPDGFLYCTLDKGHLSTNHIDVATGSSWPTTEKENNETSDD